MHIRLKPLQKQVIVITGASSGIGLVTARMAARRGARLVLASRSEKALNALADELAPHGDRPTVVLADVGKEADVERIAAAALDRYGHFDTWVNNAGVTIFGKLENIPTDDLRRLFETNFWGLVYGSRAAVRHLKQRDGGAIINVGSVSSYVPVIYQCMYSASKHAAKGFTDALRMELEADGYPISVTLITPGGINTPYPKHAKNYLDRENAIPSPLYAPETVARAILHAATHRVRHVHVGFEAKLATTEARYAPRLHDWFLKAFGQQVQTYRRPARPLEQNALHQPSDAFIPLSERGDPDQFTFEHSPYTTVSLRPKTSTAVLLGVAALAGLGLYAATRKD